jgi:hypothetical protein
VFISAWKEWLQWRQAGTDSKLFESRRTVASQFETGLQEINHMGTQPKRVGNAILAHFCRGRTESAKWQCSGSSRTSRRLKESFEHYLGHGRLKSAFWLVQRGARRPSKERCVYIRNCMRAFLAAPSEQQVDLWESSRSYRKARRKTVDPRIRSQVSAL